MPGFNRECAVGKVSPRRHGAGDEAHLPYDAAKTGILPSLYTTDDTGAVLAIYGAHDGPHFSLPLFTPMNCKIFGVGELLWDLLPAKRQLGGALIVSSAIS